MPCSSWVPLAACVVGSCLPALAEDEGVCSAGRGVGDPPGSVLLQRSAPLHRSKEWCSHATSGDCPGAGTGFTLKPPVSNSSFPDAWTKSFSEEVLLQSQREADRWAEEVKDAMRHTWAGYKARAWGHDEVKPVTGRPADWCKLAITMLDSLSTLWLMGLHHEFDEAAEFLRASPMPSNGSHGMHSMFEINIRALGGLLSAHSVSGVPVFLDTAKRLGDVLLRSFDNQSGLPHASIDVGTGQSSSSSDAVVLAEATTLQVEFRHLTHATGDPRYQAAADAAEQVVLQAAGHQGIVPVNLVLSKPPGPPRFMGTTVSMGGQGDSYYEYLLKQWLQTGKKENKFKQQWLLAMEEMVSQLVMKTSGGRTFVAQLTNGRRVPRMEHLSCFVGGMLMLGSRTLPAHEVSPSWEQLAADIGETCYEMSRRTKSGLAPEYTYFNMQADKGHDMHVPADGANNLLRPEAIETLYYLHYYTGDPKYRRWAYEMFSAFEKHCKTSFGYSAVADVMRLPVLLKDSQQSFWLAETLKYFYLIFAPRSALDLDEYLLNTEAQPLRMWS